MNLDRHVHKIMILGMLTFPPLNLHVRGLNLLAENDNTNCNNSRRKKLHQKL